METFETYENVRIINDEPEFCAFDKTRVSADFFVLYEENGTKLFGKNVADCEICGMSLLNWVVRACALQPKIIKIDRDEDAISAVKPYINAEKEYSVVFYADTPLLNKIHVLDLLGFVDRKRMGVCQFKRGFVFRNEYIAENDAIYSTDMFEFSTNDFFQVKTAEDFASVREALNKKVLDYHKRNGVFFENEQNVSVDANADIGFGCEICSGVSIESSAIIGTNSKLKKNVIVSGSKLGDNVVVGNGTIIVNSIIKNGTIVGDGVVIKNSVVGNNSKIEVASKILSSSIRDNVVIKENVIVDESKIEDGTIINKHSQILGITDKTIVGKNCEICANSFVQDSKLVDDEFVEIGAVIKNNKVEK